MHLLRNLPKSHVAIWSGITPYFSKISIFVLVFITTGQTHLQAEDQDSTLNKAYQAALARKMINVDFFKQTELRWIAYRDAEADLQARISGGQKPDEAAREASRKESTEIRTKELLHLAKDGLSGDPTNGPLEEEAIENAYATLRKTVIATHDPNLISAVISDQKAWAAFSDLQADYDGPGPSDSNAENRRITHVRLDQLRLAQLQSDLLKLGVHEKDTGDAQNDSPVVNDQLTEVSPDHSMRIEQTDDTAGDINGYPTSETSWVISNQTGQREILPTKDYEVGVGRGNPTVAVSEYSISPDSQYIFRTQKFYHGMNGAYLYKKVAGLHYAKATARPMDILAWQFFQTKTHADSSQGGVIRFVAWGPHSLRISLNASERLTFADVNDWELEYDLTTAAFSVPSDKIGHNSQAFKAPSR
jgi:uncharacterized protein YecT (DUF1311 family)